MNDLEKVAMNTMAFAHCGNNMTKENAFKKGWELRAEYRGPGANLPVSPAVLTKRELGAFMILQGMMAYGGWHRDLHSLTEKAVETSNILFEKLGS